MESSDAGKYSDKIKKVNLYRYWNKETKDHFYTTNKDEIGTTIPGKTGKYGYKSEGNIGRCFDVPSAKDVPSGMIPLYRYWNPKIKDHFYTTKKDEIGTVTAGKTGKYGFKSEGITCYIWKSLTPPPSKGSSNSMSKTEDVKVSCTLQTS